MLFLPHLSANVSRLGLDLPNGQSQIKEPQTDENYSTEDLDMGSFHVVSKRGVVFGWAAGKMGVSPKRLKKNS